MTTEENEPQIPFSPLLADIFTANAKQSEAIANRVLDNKDRQIAELRLNYVTLWEAIDRANERIDSLTLDRIIGKHEMRISSAQEALRKSAN